MCDMCHTLVFLWCSYDRYMRHRKKAKVAWFRYMQHLFCEARRASHCHSPQTTFSSNSTCCVLSTEKSAMHVVVYADRLTTQHSIVDIVDWSWSYWQIWYPRWYVECFWPVLAAHWISSASHTSVLPQHPRRKIQGRLKPSHKRLLRVNVSSHRHMT